MRKGGGGRPLNSVVRQHVNAVDFRSAEWNALTTFYRSACEKLEASGFGALTEPERTTFCVWIANAEVVNGGMHAICYNSSGDYLPSIQTAFREIGAARKASLFEQLAKAFGPSGPSTDWDTRINEHSSLSERSIAIIDALDKQYYSTAEDIEQLLLGYLERKGMVVIPKGKRDG